MKSRELPRPVAVRRAALRLPRSLDRIRYRTWFRDKEFTTDWASGNFGLWRRVLAPLRAEPIRILEIGSWEGRSALFFLNFFESSTIVCIDTFAGNIEEAQIYQTLAEQLQEVEQRFDRNLAPFNHRVEKIKSRSVPALDTLKAAGRPFDLAYIDGSHWRDEVMADSRGVWELLSSNGIIIWDDYGWGSKLPPEQRPQPAIDDFLRERQGAYRLLHKGYQLVIERIAATRIRGRSPSQALS